MNYQKAYAAVVAGVAVVALAGCSTEAPVKVTVSAPAEEVVESTTPSPEPSDEAAPGADLPGDVTAPGAALAIGETALVDWDHYEHGLVRLAVTVTDVRTGSLADLESLNLSEDTKAQIQGYTPYYIDVTVVKADLSQGALEFSALSGNIEGLNSDGASLASFTVFGSFDLCDSGSFEPGVDEGETQTTCEIVMVPGGQSFGSAQWQDYDTAYDKYDGSPITWS